MDQRIDQYCIIHKDQYFEYICVQENCCKKLKCPQCDYKNCRIIKLSIINKRFKQFKDDLNKIIQQIDNYHKQIIVSLQYNKFELIHQDILNTQNIISLFEEHLNIINIRSVVGNQQPQQQQEQQIDYDSNLYCTVIGHQDLKIVSINMNRMQGGPELFCNMCNVDLQYSLNFTSIRKICQDYVNLKEIKEIQILQLQHYDQYLKKLRQLTNLVEEQTMHNYIKDKLTYFDNKQLNLKEIFDDKFVLFLRPKIFQVDDVTKRKLYLIKNRLQQNNIDKIDIGNMDKQMLYKFNVDYNFKLELNSEYNAGYTFYGPKLTANLNNIQLITIHDPQSQLLLNSAKISFIDQNDQVIESFTVFTSGIISYKDKDLPEKFTKQIDASSYQFQINFYLFQGKKLSYYILLSYQGQMILKQLQNLKDLKYFQVQVYLYGEKATGRIVTQQF